MKKMPMVKRILAAAMVIAMVATSAKFDWNSLIGKAEEMGASIAISGGGSIAQTYTYEGSGIQQINKIRVQASLVKDQSATITGKIYRNCTSIDNTAGAASVNLSSDTKQTTEEEGAVVVYELVPMSAVCLASGESAVVELTISTTGSIDVYQTVTSSSQTFVIQDPSVNPSYVGFGNTIAMVDIKDPDAGVTDSEVTEIATDRTSIVVNEGESAVITPTLTPNIKRAVTTSGYSASIEVSDQADDGSFTVKGLSAGETSITFSCGSASTVVPVYVLRTTLSPTAITYGDPAPTVTVFNGTRDLTEITEYTASVDEENHKVYVTGAGTYAGYQWEKTYTVDPKDINDVKSWFDDIDATYEFNITTNTLTSINVPGLTEGTDYIITNVVRKSVVGQSITYTLTVQGIGNYNNSFDLDKTITATGVKVDIADIAVLGSITPKDFTGSDIEPAGEIKFYSATDPDQEITIPTTNYKIVYSNNKNSGTATVTAQGIGDYTGEISTTFKINKVNLSNVTIDQISDQGYTGSAIEPPLTVTYNGYSLTKGTDYTVTYSGNTNVGTNTAKATLTGMKNFKGTKEVTFSIVGSLTSAEVTLENSYVASAGEDTGYSVVYTGADVKPEVTALEIGGTELNLDNYNVTYASNKNAGTARVYIEDKNDSTKKTYVTFEIKKRSLASPQEVSFAPTSVVYTTESTSSLVTPTVKLKYNNKVNTLLKDTDYEVVYENDINVGTVKATIKGIGNFTGEKTVGSAYTITKLNAADTVIEDIADIVYTGSAIEPVPVVKTRAGKVIGAENYTVSWSNNIDVGTATLTITGKNYLTGTKQKPFRITPCDMWNNVTFYLDNQEYGKTADDTIAFSEAVSPLTKEYTGSAVTTIIRLKDQNGNNISPTNYEAIYENNVSVSTASYAKVIITGKNKYKNQTVTLEYKISQKSLGNGETAGDGISAVYNPETGVLTVKDSKRAGGHQTLTEGADKDYTVTWGDGTLDKATYNSTSGPKNVTVTGVGNYTGSYKLNYTIGTDISTNEDIFVQYGHLIMNNSSLIKEKEQRKTLNTVRNLTQNNKETFETYYLGNQARPKIELYTANDGVIPAAGNYEVLYDPQGGGYDAGSRVTVTIKAVEGSANFYGEIKLYYDVKKIEGVNNFNTFIKDPKNDSYAFTGEEVEVYPTLNYDTTDFAEVITYEGTEKTTVLTKNVDYTTSTEDSLNEVGNKTVKITFKDTCTNFAGNTNRPTVVTTADPKDITIGPSADKNYRTEDPSDPGKALERQGDSAPYTYQFGRTLPYTGGEIIPFTTKLTNGATNGAWNLYYGGKIIDPSTYSVSYYSNEAMTTPATPGESGNYYFDIDLSIGSVKNFGDDAHIYGSFAIAGRDLSTATLIPEVSEYIYDGNAHKPGFVLVYEDQIITLDESKFEVKYEPIEVSVPGSTTDTRLLGDTACKNPGLYQIKVKGKAGSNFATDSEKTCNYKIIGKFLNSSSSLLDLREKNDTDEKIEGNAYKITKESTLNSGDIFKSEFDDKEFYLHFGDADYEQYAGFYTVTGKNLTVPGSGTVTVSTNSEYFIGTKTYNVKALGKLSDVEITGWADNRVYPYTGQTVLPPGLLITYNGEPLREGRDYSASATNATAVGTATLKIEPGTNGLYTGSKSEEYYIRYDLSQAEIKINNSAADLVYDGTDKNIDFTVYYPDSTAANGKKELTKNTDYEVDPTKYSAVGSGYVIINPIDGKSYNTNQKSFSITGIDIRDESKVTFSPIANQTYTGAEIRPDVVAKLKGTTPMIYGTDYTLSYTHNKDVGTATVTVTGINNYTGTKPLNFDIDQRDIADATINLMTTQVPYNGGDNVVLTEGTDYTVTDGSKVLVKDTDYTVKVDDRNSINDPAGHITIYGKGNYRGSKQSEASFTVVAANIASGDVTVDQHSAEYTGSEIYPENFITLKMNGKDLNKTCFDISIQGVNGNTIKNVDEYTITLTGKAPNYTGSKTIDFKITPKELDITRFTWALDKTSWDYDNGNPVEPELVTHKDNTLGVLEEGKDYTVSYVHNTESGSASDENGPAVKVSGMGNYTGEVLVHFSIGQDISSATATLAQTEYPYDGKEHKPKVTSVKLGEKSLKLNTDYTVTYPTDVTSVETKTVTVTGTGGYYGTVTKTYAITKRTAADGDIVVTPRDYQVNNNGTVADKTDDWYYTIYPGEAVVGDGLEPELKVYDNATKTELTANDYEVIPNGYINNKTAGSATNRATVTIKLKGNYNERTVDGTFVILPRSLSDADTLATVEFVDPNFTNDTVKWTGDEIIPDEVRVTDDVGNLLEEGRDYELSFANNTNVGTADGDAKVTITGKGNYTGTLEKTFVIYADLQEAQVSDIPEMFYTGQKIIPHPTITSGGRELVEGTDYTLDSYSSDNFKTVGTLRISAKDQTHYKNGPLNVDFTVGSDTTSLTVNIPQSTYAYTGGAIKPAVTVTDGGGSELVCDADKVTYVSDADGEKCIAVGTVTVTVKIPTADGTEVEKTGTYQITKRDINDCRISSISNDTYTGQELKPPVVIVLDGKELVEDTDYKLTYTDNVNPGTASVKVEGIGSCKGEKDLVFAIAPAKVTNVEAYGYSDTGILVKWTAQNHVDGYLLTYSVNGKTKEVTTTNASYTITGLSAGTAYTVDVCTYVTAGGRKYFGTATEATASTFIAAPSYLVTSTEKNQATLSWNTAVFNGGYMIYRSDNPNTGFKRVADVPSTKNSWTNKNLTSGKTYYYYIQAYQVNNGVVDRKSGVKSAIKSIKVK